jgi:hypothetical protein
MLKIDFLKTLGIAAVATPVALARAATKADAADDADALTGLWKVTVTAPGATYHYVYAISRGSYVATSDADENYMDSKYSPTMGAYVPTGNGSYRFRGAGYIFDLKGKNRGSFKSVGTFRLNADRNRFQGTGLFTEYDLKSKPTSTERLTVTAERLPA